MMSLNPLAPITDYQSMLNRIFWFTTACALAGVWMLRLYVPAIDASLGKIDLAIASRVDKLLPIAGGYLLPALLVGILARVFRLHARISDWLGIRESFETEVILAEFGRRLGVDLEAGSDEPLRRARHHIMRQAFYPYVGGAHAQIDQQLVYQALDAWSWFWVGVEATFVITLTSFTLIAFDAYRIGFQTLAVAIALAMFGLPTIRSQCKRYAIAQVREILADSQRAAVARAAFNQLTGVASEQAVGRRAAA